VTIDVRNPADGKVAGEVPVDTSEAVASKVRELRLFQPEWEAIGPKGRKPWLLRFQDWMFDNSEHIIPTRSRTAHIDCLQGLVTSQQLVAIPIIVDQ
jgi:acyl-CoA reductase-like NAD-dependent aldehyde dehydrogenase